MGTRGDSGGWGGLMMSRRRRLRLGWGVGVWEERVVPGVKDMVEPAWREMEAAFARASARLFKWRLTW